MIGDIYIFWMDSAKQLGILINKLWKNKIKNGYLRLIILMLVSLVSGLHMLISPESVSYWVIRGVGFIFTIEAISYATEVVKKYIEIKQL